MMQVYFNSEYWYLGLKKKTTINDERDSTNSHKADKLQKILYYTYLQNIRKKNFSALRIIKTHHLSSIRNMYKNLSNTQ